MKVKYLIVGNGIAGHSAAKEIRKHDKEGSIVIITKEKRNTYFRIQLTAYIASGYDPEKIYVNKPEWFEKNNIEVLLEKNIVAIDPEFKKVELESGEVIEGEKILLAMGSNPFIPPIEGVEKKGVFALRTLEDLDSFLSYMDNIDDVTVIGGGLLGLEAANSVRKKGKKVTVIEVAPYVLSKQLNEELGKKLNKDLELLGIHVHAGEGVKELIGADTVEEIVLESGKTFSTQAVLLSSGVKPNLELVKNTNLEINRGIVVNENLETNFPDIYAAGDIAEVQGITLGLWTASMEMGKIAGNNMSNSERLEKYETPKLFTALEIEDINIFSCGNLFNFDTIYKYDDEEVHHRVFAKDGKIEGAILEGNTKEKNLFKKIVFNHLPESALKESSVPFQK